MIEYNLSSARGKQIYNMGITCYAKCLETLYDRPSKAKQLAFDKCWEEYYADDNSSDFGAGNANTFSFTCSWLTEKNGEDVMVVKTKFNDYLVWLNRQYDRRKDRFNSYPAFPHKKCEIKKENEKEK